MMNPSRYNELSVGGDDHFQDAWRILEDGIPPDERRTFEQQQQVLADRRYRFVPFLELTGKVVGVLGSWQFPDFLFVEHIAVDPTFRNRGFGSEIMTNVCTQSRSPVVLETDVPAAGEIAVRRIEWYRRLSFTMNTADYMQPPYSMEKHSVPMKLMSFPKVLSALDFQKFVGVLYTEVYKNLNNNTVGE